jgi:transglutaminase-like putative cysteine protease
VGAALLLLVVVGVAGRVSLRPAIAAPEQTELGLERAQLPWSFRVVRETTVEGASLATLTARWGVGARALHNQVLDVRGIALQVNTVVCDDVAGAKRLLERFRAMPGGPQRHTFRRETRVFEILSPNPFLLRYARHLLGEDVPAVRWRLRCRVAVTEGGDAMAAQPLMAELLRVGAEPGEAHRTDVLNDLRDRLTFPSRETATWDVVADSERQSLRLLAVRPEPDAVGNADDRVRLSLATARLERVHGIPVLDVEGEAVVHAGFRPHLGPAAKDEPFSEAADAGAATALSEALSAAAAGEREDRAARVAAIHRWVVENVRYDGPMGSRHGVGRVLEQRFGRCWDFTDVVVAMCRAAGIPARSVAGWLPDVGGHVWCEVEVRPDDDGDGCSHWQSVDATVPWLGIDERYVALWPAERPLVYAALPSFEREAAPESDTSRQRTRGWR